MVELEKGKGKVEGKKKINGRLEVEVLIVRKERKENSFIIKICSLLLIW